MTTIPSFDDDRPEEQNPAEVNQSTPDQQAQELPDFDQAQVSEDRDAAQTDPQGRPAPDAEEDSAPGPATEALLAAVERFATLAGQSRSAEDFENEITAETGPALVVGGIGTLVQDGLDDDRTDAEAVEHIQSLVPDEDDIATFYLDDSDLEAINGLRGLLVAVLDEDADIPTAEEVDEDARREVDQAIIDIGPRLENPTGEADRTRMHEATLRERVFHLMVLYALSEQKLGPLTSQS